MQYQQSMMRCMREVNVDHHQVGWYQVRHSSLAVRSRAA